MGDAPHIDWANWLYRWDRQQEGYVPQREARFTAMLDAVEVLLPQEFLALDLGAGPGSLSRRLLARFPAARVVAVEIDPVMVAVGKGAIGTVDDRLRWVEADLASSKWLEAVGEEQVDVALSATALHWLPPQPLKRLYGELAGLLHSGGLFLNADHIDFGIETCDRLSRHILDTQWSDEAFASRGIDTAEQWWEEFKAQPGISHLLDEQARRFAGKHRQPSLPDFAAHEAALRNAGFHEVATIWQKLSDRVVLAVR